MRFQDRIAVVTVGASGMSNAIRSTFYAFDARGCTDYLTYEGVEAD